MCKCRHEKSKYEREIRADTQLPYADTIVYCRYHVDRQRNHRKGTGTVSEAEVYLTVQNITTASDAHCPEDVGDRILELNNSLGNNYV